MIKEKFFKRNGGLLLQQQLSADDRELSTKQGFSLLKSSTRSLFTSVEIEYSDEVAKVQSTKGC